MNAKQHGLSAYIPVLNPTRLDYSWRESATSLLGVADELIFIDAGSDDGSLEEMRQWANIDSRVRIIHYDLPRLPTWEEVDRDDLTRPKGDPRMLIHWLNYARQFCDFDHQISLDADEVLDPKGYPEIRKAVEDGIPRWFNRVNFWGDPFHEAPHGTVCGERVAKLGPTRYEMVSDEPRPEGEPEMRKLAINGQHLKIFHLGFLRRPDAFLRKSRVVQAMIHNCYDPRLREAEQTGKSWVELSPFPKGKELLAYPHHDWPPYVNDWLKERGYSI